MNRRIIRLGLVSRFFTNHTVGKLHAGLVRHLSRDWFHVIVFRFAASEDDWARRIDADADEVVVLTAHLEAAQAQIAERQLDVLYFTDIGMEALTYYLAFARLAPVQCTGWGHPLTSGIPTVDYFISSEHLEPPGADEHYTERLVRLKSLPTCFDRPHFLPPAKNRAAFGLSDEEHLYLCPQSLFKLHPSFDKLLGAILEADLGGRVVLLAGQQANFAELLAQRLARTIPQQRERVTFLPRQSPDDLLRLLSVADVLLDTTHFSGGITSLEALALGVPVVTLPGAYMRGRVTYACYRQMDWTGCVAQDEADYVRLAVRLGTDPAYRQQASEAILARGKTLFEHIESVREFEQFFLQAVDAAGSKPALTPSDLQRAATSEKRT